MIRKPGDNYMQTLTDLRLAYKKRSETVEPVEDKVTIQEEAAAPEEAAEPEKKTKKTKKTTKKTTVKEGE